MISCHMMSFWHHVRMSQKTPSLNALRAFEAAARHQNFRRAAGELALTESAISRQIALLEDRLGVLLFERNKRRVSLTQAGALYARQVADVLVTLERNTLDVMAHAGAGGVIELASLPTLASEWLIPRLPDFLREHPQVVVNISTRSELFLFEGTKFDAAIHCGAPNWPNAQAKLMFGEESVPVCHPSLVGDRRDLSTEELAALPLLHLATRRSDWQQWFDAGDSGSVNAMRGPSFEQHTLVISAALAKLGIALLPQFLAKKYIDSGLLVCPCERRLRTARAYYFVYPDARPLGHPLVLFRDWLLAQSLAFPGA